MNSDTTDATPSILQGVWEVDCYLDTELPTEIDAVYRKVNVSFTGGSSGNFESTFSGHSSANCAEPATATQSGTFTGTYLIGSNIMSTDGVQVTELDITRNSLTTLEGDTISPILDKPVVLDIFYFDSTSLFFGVNNDPDADPPVRPTSIDFSMPLTKQ